MTHSAWREADPPAAASPNGAAAIDLAHLERQTLGDRAVMLEVLALFARDKKAVHGVTLVLDGPNGVESVTGIDERVLRDAMEAVR